MQTNRNIAYRLAYETATLELDFHDRDFMEVDRTPPPC